MRSEASKIRQEHFTLRTCEEGAILAPFLQPCSGKDGLNE
jgi:hypothetical protein